MQRDARVGQEHWSGCHSFSNIICDGDVTGSMTPRQGGLRMGGTYWYYVCGALYYNACLCLRLFQYTLDDKIEFHNSAEPSTTTCPMLPGQLVNVLNVPFALTSGGRSRNTSVSSTSSDHRTMDPADKFLNPRPVPTKPRLPRLKTSPTFPQQPWSSSSSPVSASSDFSRRGRSATTRVPSPPCSANILALVRPKPSAEIPSRSTSQGSNRSVGIIGGVKAIASPLVTSPGATSEQGTTPTDILWSPAFRSGRSSVRSVTPKRGTSRSASSGLRGDEVPSGPARELAFRKDFGDAAENQVAVPISSFAQHRRQRSRSREPSSLRNAQQRDTSPELTTFGQNTILHQPLDTVKEVASATNTPVWPVTALKVDGKDDGRKPFDLEKRLPTLPNTPSSVYPASIADEDTQEAGLADVGVPGSHFSCTTIDSEAYINSYICNDNSRFSDWTDAPKQLSPRSPCASSILDFESLSPPAEPALEHPADIANNVDGQPEHEQGSNHASQQHGLPSASSFSTVNSVASSAAPSSYADPDSAKSGRFSWSKFQHYSLPSEEPGSGITIKPAPTTEHAGAVVADEQERAHVAGRPELAIVHSSSMQELLEELSYLGGMIQQH